MSLSKPPASSAILKHLHPFYPIILFVACRISATWGIWSLYQRLGTGARRSTGRSAVETLQGSVGCRCRAPLGALPPAPYLTFVCNPYPKSPSGAGHLKAPCLSNYLSRASLSSRAPFHAQVILTSCLPLKRLPVLIVALSSSHQGLRPRQRSCKRLRTHKHKYPLCASMQASRHAYWLVGLCICLRCGPVHAGLCCTGPYLSTSLHPQARRPAHPSCVCACMCVLCGACV